MVFEDSLAGTIPLLGVLRVNLCLEHPTRCWGFLPRTGNFVPSNFGEGEVSCCVCMVFPPFSKASVEEAPSLFNAISRTAFDLLRSAFSKSSFAWTCSSCYLSHAEKKIHLEIFVNHDEVARSLNDF